MIYERKCKLVSADLITPRSELNNVFIIVTPYSPPSLEHESAVSEGKSNLAKPDTHGAGYDVWTGVHYYRLKQRN